MSSVSPIESTQGTPDDAIQEDPLRPEAPTRSTLSERPLITTPRESMGWLTTPVFACVFLLLLAITAALGAVGAPGIFVGLGAIACVVLFVTTLAVAAVRTLIGVWRLAQIARGQSDLGPGSTLLATLGNLAMVTFGMWLAYLSTLGFSRGRQLRRFGRVLLPATGAGRRWVTQPLNIDEHASAPAGLAHQWRENGKTEHASVAAFARLTLDLMALGAPPTLIAAANRDALDEIRHAELCFSLASALDGQEISPSPFPEAQRVGTLPRSRTLALAQLAVDSLVDGALHEGVSARIISKLAQRCEVPTVRVALKEIAADEGLHAAHGWTVAEWCLAAGGTPVAQALLGAVQQLPMEMRTALPEGAADGGWERWGIHGHALEAQEYRAARAHVVGRVQAMVTSLKAA
jgi:hypothetical protein